MADHRGGLFPHQLGILVLIQLVELYDHRCQPWIAADLTRPSRPELMQHLLCRHPHQILVNWIQAHDIVSTRMIAKHPVSVTLASAIKLDAADNRCAAG